MHNVSRVVGNVNCRCGLDGCLTATPDLELLPDVDPVGIAQVVSCGQLRVGGIKLSSDTREGVTTLNGVRRCRGGTSTGSVVRTGAGCCYMLIRGGRLGVQLEPLPDVDPVRITQMVELSQTRVGGVELVGNAREGVTTLNGVGTSH